MTKQNSIIWSSGVIGLGILLWSNSLLGAGTNLPATPAELNRWYAEPPVGHNAATSILAGTSALKIIQADTDSARLPVIGQGAMPRPDQPVPPEVQAAMAELVQRNQRALLLIAQGAALPQSRYPIDLNRGFATQLPHLVMVKQSAQLLELAVVSKAAAGRGGEAGDALLVSLALTRSLESEPLVISQLVRVACGNILLNGLEQALNRVVLPAPTLEQLQKSLQRSETAEASGFGFTRAFVGEQVTGLAVFAMPPEQFLNEQGLAGAKEIARLAPIIKQNLEADRQLYAATFDRVLAARATVFPARLKQDEIFASAASEATNKNYYFCRMLLPGLQRTAGREAIRLASLRLAQAGVALEQFRSTHGNRYPESLGELTPHYLGAVPADPFDGQSLRYHRADKGYVLYSIGRDLRDDGGRRLDNRQQGDLVFNVVHPP